MRLNNTPQELIKFFATGAYAGYSPYAPGTAGTLTGVLVYLAISHLSNSAYVFVTISIFLLGIPIASKAEKIFGEKDHCAIVIDEISGYLIAMLFIPSTIFWIASGFLLFRILDIIKPLASLEKIHGGIGIMIDDLVAGIICNALLHVVKLLHYSFTLWK